MGAWSEGSFDNDDAGDWVWELEKAEDFSILEEAFSAVTDAGDDPEASDCSVAVAAAEVVAALRHQPAAKLPDEAEGFVARLDRPPSPELVAAALAALRRVKKRSELQELWDESKDGEKWHEAIEELESRLQ
jgi:hypothetical protein